MALPHFIVSERRLIFFAKHGEIPNPPEASDLLTERPFRPLEETSQRVLKVDEFLHSESVLVVRAQHALDRAAAIVRISQRNGYEEPKILLGQADRLKDMMARLSGTAESKARKSLSLDIEALLGKLEARLSSITGPKYLNTPEFGRNNGIGIPEGTGPYNYRKLAGRDTYAIGWAFDVPAGTRVQLLNARTKSGGTFSLELPSGPGALSNEDASIRRQVATVNGTAVDRYTVGLNWSHCDLQVGDVIYPTDSLNAFGPPPSMPRVVERPSAVAPEVLPPPREVTEPEVLPPPREVAEPEVLPSPREVTEPEILPPPRDVTEPEALPPPREVTEPEVLPPPREVTEPEPPPPSRKEPEKAKAPHEYFERHKSWAAAKRKSSAARSDWEGARDDRKEDARKTYLAALTEERVALNQLIKTLAGTRHIEGYEKVRDEINRNIDSIQTTDERRETYRLRVLNVSRRVKEKIESLRDEKAMTDRETRKKRLESAQLSVALLGGMFHPEGAYGKLRKAGSAYDAALDELARDIHELDILVRDWKARP